MDEKDEGEDGYLILTRRPNESVRIGEDILIHVISVGRNVRISIEAPDDKRILRSELLEQAVAVEPAEHSPQQATASHSAPVQTQESTPEVTTRRKPKVAEGGARYQTESPTARKQAPVVKYRRRRKTMTLAGRHGDSNAE